MGEFKVNCVHGTNYFDSEYSSLNLNVVVQAAVNCQERTGDEKDIKFINGLISEALDKQLSAFERERIPYKDLVSKCDELAKAVSDILAGNKAEPLSVAVASITPDERSMRSIELINKVNAVKNMSTEDYTKRLDDAQKTAQARLEGMTPAGRAKGDEQTLKSDEEMKQKLVMSAKIAAAAGAVAGAAAIDASSSKKFCKSCGAPRGNGKFCRVCGKPV